MTAHSMQLWVPAVADGRFGSSVAAPASSEKQGDTEPSGKNAEIVRLPKPCLSKLRKSIREDAAELFWRTFDGGSLNAKCADAAGKIRGVSADTFARLIEGETVNPCSLILGHCAAIVRRKTGKPTPICRVLGRIFAAEIAP